MSNQVFFAPVGADLRDLASWTPIGVTDAQATYEQPQDAAEDIYGWQFGNHSLSLSFTMARRDLRRIKKLFPVSRAELRRSAMRSAYRRRRRTR